MSKTRLAVACAVALISGAGAAAAQPAATPQTVPLRAVSVVGATTETIGAILGLKHLPDGRLLVNDARRRRVLVFDASLTKYDVLIDSAGGANNYGLRSAPFIPFVADSTLFVDYTSQSLLVIDPKGAISRVTTPPKPSDLNWLGSGAAGVDAKGRLVYRGYERLPMVPFSLNQTTTTSQAPDSAPIVRADFDTRTVDTLARVKMFSGSKTTTTRSTAGPPTSSKQTINPLSWVDEWAIHADGSIAIVRGQDYHIDWINADGSRSATPKMPYDWRRLTDEDKQRLIDSTRRVLDSVSATGGYVMRGSMSGPNGTQTYTIAIQFEFVPLSEIPDYYPPMRPGAVKADPDGNIWILPFTSAQGGGKGIVYDVVNRKGELYERVQVPEKRSIVGFGAGGIVYLMFGDLKDGFRIERATVAR